MLLAQFCFYFSDPDSFQNKEKAENRVLLFNTVGHFFMQLLKQWQISSLSMKKKFLVLTLL